MQPSDIHHMCNRNRFSVMPSIYLIFHPLLSHDKIWRQRGTNRWWQIYQETNVRQSIHVKWCEPLPLPQKKKIFEHIVFHMKLFGKLQFEKRKNTFHTSHTTLNSEKDKMNRHYIYGKCNRNLVYGNWRMAKLVAKLQFKYSVIIVERCQMRILPNVMQHKLANGHTTYLT